MSGHDGTPSRPNRGPTAEDRRLLEAIRAGDPAAFDRFVERFGPMIWAFGLRMCGHREDAEDVFQEALVKVFTSLRQLENPAALRTWLWRVVANECRMSRRGPRDPSRQVGLDDLGARDDGAPYDPPDETAASPERQVLDRETRARVERAVRNLPPDYRIIVLLRDFEGLTTQEVAEVLGITQTNAKVRLHRARLALRRLLEQDDAARAGGAA
ncbi:MAG: sigma-70 family RNA polymerase sigma factor [Acidobacteria bacterium]|nr:MAG: sigma-70 family RNA polymerase sigma factor [Acidobacteriota bacterium]